MYPYITLSHFQTAYPQFSCYLFYFGLMLYVVCKCQTSSLIEVNLYSKPLPILK